MFSKVKERGNSTWNMGVYAHHRKKTFSKYQKKLYKKLSMYVLTFYVHVPSFAENQHFL
jgi:hypothetical protein